MRLWTLEIIKQLPRQQLLGQHRECCALRGKGWDRKHATVDYVFRHAYYLLFLYHRQVMFEMMNRRMFPDIKWLLRRYRGRLIGMDYTDFTKTVVVEFDNRAIYPEHDEKYLQECIENLARKGVLIEKRNLVA